VTWKEAKAAFAQGVAGLAKENRALCQTCRICFFVELRRTICLEISTRRMATLARCLSAAGARRRDQFPCAARGRRVAAISTRNAIRADVPATLAKDQAGQGYDDSRRIVRPHQEAGQPNLTRHCRARV